MWKRNVLKKKVRAALKQNYWTMVSVCFIIAMLTSAYPVSTAFLSSHAVLPDSSLVMPAPFSPDASNSEIIRETVRHFFSGSFLSELLPASESGPVSLIIDLLSSGISAAFAVLRAVNNFVTENWDSSTFFLVLGVIVAVVYQLFVGNILLIGEKRFFLENHSYRKTPISKIFCLYKLRCFTGPAWIMFCRSLFQALWNLTVVGGIIKFYEYRMIPYILAENPKVSRRDAFFLSRQLMHRNKWKLFRLHLSFLGWKILSVLTLGILDLVFVNPYMTGCEAELYLTLRRNYVLSRSPRYENLSDSYLEHVPSEDELLISKALYDDSRGPYTKISYFAPEQYPVFLFSVQPPFSAGDLSGILMPFMPWVPIYGLYGILILLIVKHVYDKPVLAFLLNFLIYSLLEYFISAASELAFGYIPWDYSGYFLNINGRVYAGGSVSVALLGCAFLYYFAPRWTDLFLKLKKGYRILLCTVLTLLFAADAIFAVMRCI